MSSIARHGSGKGGLDGDTYTHVGTQNDRKAGEVLLAYDKES